MSGAPITPVAPSAADGLDRPFDPGKEAILPLGQGFFMKNAPDDESGNDDLKNAGEDEIS